MKLGANLEVTYGLAVTFNTPNTSSRCVTLTLKQVHLANQIHFIGASLKPHTSRTALGKCVYVCLLACGHIP